VITPWKTLMRGPRPRLGRDPGIVTTVPVQEVFDAERLAAETLEKWWWPTRGGIPVDPIALARDLGIEVRIVRLPADQSGKIVLSRDETPVISLNRDDSLNRRRFTCAHEIGHYERRSHDAENEEFIDFRDTLAGLGVDPAEVFANQYAAALLMPPGDVRRLFEAGSSEDEMARTFVTSPQAMRLRLKNLRLL
jgi:Zn-dependent peptidase ImmA (M78 family)